VECITLYLLCKNTIGGVRTDIVMNRTGTGSG